MTGYAEKFLRHLHESVVIGMILTICHIGMAAGAIEAMGAYAAFRKADAVDKMLDFAELQCGEVQTACDFVDHTLIFGCAGGGIAVKLCRIVTFEITDNLTGYQLEVVFGGCKTNERAPENQRGA